MKKVMTLLMAVLMIFSLAACKDNDSTEPSSTSGEALYDMPDFSVPPVATGNQPKVTLQEMVNLVNNTDKFTYAFADQLETSKQTVYQTEALQDGEVLKESVSPLGLITMTLKYVDLPALGTLDPSDFEFYDSDRMAKVKEAKRPNEFMDCVVTDVCFDLTDASIIIRTASVIEQEDEESTYFCTIKLTYLDDNQYKLYVRTEDYGAVQSKEYVYITEETFNFTSDKSAVMDGQYHCAQNTSLAYETTLDVGGSDKTTTTTIKRSERITVDIDIKCNDGIYTVDREMIMKQSDESYDPADATEIYRVNQHVEQKDGIYVLTEHAKGTGKDGKPVDSTQYVTFTEKTT